MRIIVAALVSGIVACGFAADPSTAGGAAAADVDATWQAGRVAEQRRFLDVIEPILSHADAVELLSLDPSGARGEAADRDLATWQELGRASLAGADVVALDTAFRRSVEAIGDPAFCFVPRHAIIARRGATTLTLLVCFQCGQVKGKLGDDSVSATIARLGEAEFDRILTAANVRIAPKSP